MTLIPPAARARARSSLVDTCTISRPGADSTIAGVLTPGSPTTVATGPCSLSPASSQDRSPAGGGDALIGTRTLRLDPDLVGVNDIKPGDQVTVASHAGPLVVHSIDDRTLEVLRRVTVVEPVNARPVPT